jgi:5-methylcytosine-specific restriction protein A
MPTRLCNERGCPNPATRRGKCDEHRKQAERERSARRRENNKGVYKRKIWEMRRRQVLSEQPICAICDNHLSEEVDHIVPLTEGGAPYDRDNLRGLCRQCHWQRHQGEGLQPA